MKINSLRRYKLAICDQVGLTVEPFTLNSILAMETEKDPYEWVLALHEHIDALLDLKVGESLYFQANRDDKNSKGIALRIN